MITWWNVDVSTQQAVGTDALGLLKCTSNLEELSASDFVIEAIVESEDVKKKLFVQLDKITKRSAILASNTSSISITRLASAVSRPRQVNLTIAFFTVGLVAVNNLVMSIALNKYLTICLLQVIGMHFMNPPPIMKLVEIIRGADTSDETYNKTKALAERWVACSTPKFKCDTEVLIYGLSLSYKIIFEKIIF